MAGYQQRMNEWKTVEMTTAVLGMISYTDYMLGSMPFDSLLKINRKERQTQTLTALANGKPKAAQSIAFLAAG